MSATLTLAVPTGPFIDLTTGNVTPAWRQFLVVLAARTGGTSGMATPDVAPIEAALGVERAARQAGDITLTAGIANEANARQARDADLALAISQRVKTAGDAMTGQLMLQRVGFNGTAPILKPTISGAKGGNTALASVIALLVAYGLGSDTSTA